MSAPGRGARQRRIVVGVPLALAILLGFELAGYWTLHRSEAELWRAVEQGDPRAQVAALHVLAQRGVPSGFDAALVRRLLASPDPRVREMAMTPDVTRLTGDALQRAYLRQVRDPNQRARYRLLLVHPFEETLPGITRRQLERFYASPSVADAGAGNEERR